MPCLTPIRTPLRVRSLPVVGEAPAARAESLPGSRATGAWVGTMRDRRATDPSDEALMLGVQAGDRAAYHALVERFTGEILSYATRLLRDRTWAEDLTQEVFLRLFQKAYTFRAESKVSTWLYRVARNACFDHLKRRKHEPRPMAPRGTGDPDEPGGGLPDPLDGQPGPPRQLEQAELKERVTAALATLPERFRAPFVLVVLQGLSYDEAGAILGCSVKTLSSRLSRARDRFRRAMGDWMDAEAPRPAGAVTR